MFESLGAQVIPARLPDWFFDLSVPAGRIIASEAYSLHGAYVKDPAVPLNDAVRQRIRSAESFGPGDYPAELRTMAERRRLFARWFEDFDAVLLPTVAIPAIALDEVEEMAPIPGYLTRPANYLGLCALSQPCGFVNGLPASLQIVGKPHAEGLVLALGQAFESATDFASRHPDLAPLGLG